jgi:ferredoxin
MNKRDSKEKDLSDFRPSVTSSENVQVTRFFGLCKSCGQCIQKCPKQAISWDEVELGMLGEPAIKIDLAKCVGCELCEQICPDAAVEILNKRVERLTKKS